MLKLYNTLTKKIEEFKPIKSGEVGLYTCGPTVYNYAHIGNLRTYIFEDLLQRVLEYDGYTVDRAMNITDVGHLVGDGDEGEDKLEVGAKREGKNPLDIAKFYTDKFFADLAELNIIKPAKILAASQDIEDQLEIIKLLEQKGFTYTGDKAIYFDTSKFPEYGKLSGQKLSEKRTDREEVVVDPDKKHPADFALWFFLKGKYQNHILHWPSPWGEGFPGWHIECSAISRKLLGQPFDIHTGGVDHIGTHHANEIAQSEAAFGVPLANVWMHGEFLTIVDKFKCKDCGVDLTKELIGTISGPFEGVNILIGSCGHENGFSYTDIKMAKSGGNFITLDILKEKGFSPLDYRYMCLQAHYRKQLNFTWESLGAAKNAKENLFKFIQDQGHSIKVTDTEYLQKFKNALNEDLNVPAALSFVWELIDDTSVANDIKEATLVEFDKVLGLGIAKVPRTIKIELSESIKIESTVSLERTPSRVIDLIKERENFKKQKDFKKSDELRKQIEDLGYEVMDTPEGQKVKKKINI